MRDKKMFKTELHCHSKDVSACARVDVETIVKRYLENGYSTIVLTNHFNEGTYYHHNSKSWNEFIDVYVNGYKKLVECANGRLNVLFGMELRFSDNINDYLVFGITEEFVRNNEFFYNLNPEKFHNIAKENNMLFIQAHPFRHNMTIVNEKHLDGIEVFNGHMGHNSNNDIAEIWADKYNLIKTSGTDFHYPDVPINAGIITKDEIKDMDSLVKILKNGEYELIKG